MNITPGSVTRLVGDDITKAIGTFFTGPSESALVGSAASITGDLVGEVGLGDDLFKIVGEYAEDGYRYGVGFEVLGDVPQGLRDAIKANGSVKNVTIDGIFAIKDPGSRSYAAAVQADRIVVDLEAKLASQARIDGAFGTKGGGFFGGVGTGVPGRG